MFLYFTFCHPKCRQTTKYNISVMNKININQFNFINDNNLGVLSKTLNLHLFFGQIIYILSKYFDAAFMDKISCSCVHIVFKQLYRDMSIE